MSRGLGITLVALLLVLILGIAGLAGYVFFVMKPGALPSAVPAAQVEKAAEEETKKGAEPSFLKLKNFVTDLADKERLRYVDVAVAIAVTDDAALESAKKMEPQIRDVILSQLRSKVAGDLTGAAGKDKLAQELTEGLAPVLKKQLKKVYIVDLVIQ